MAKRKNKNRAGGQFDQEPERTASTAKKTSREVRRDRPVIMSIRDSTAAGKIAWWTILILVFLVPLLFGVAFLQRLGLSFADSFDTVKVLALRIGTAIALIAWIWDIVQNGGEIRLHKVMWLLLGLMVWIGISTLVSVNLPTAFFGKYRRYDGMWSYLMYAVLFFLTLQYATTPARIKQLAQALCWSSLFVAGYGLLQAFGQDFMQWGELPFEANRSFSTYGNPDLLVGFLAFGVFVTLGLALAEKRTSWRAFYWVVFLINAAVVITAFSRSIWVASVVGFALLVVCAVRQRTRWELLDTGFSGAVAVAVIAFIVRSLSAKDAVMNFAIRVKSIFEFGSGSAVTRFEIWNAAAKAIKARPIFGFGPDTFRLVFRKYAPAAYAQDAGYRSVADNVHNFPLQLAAGIGVIGCALFYVTIGWVLVLAAKTALKRPDADDHTGGGARILYAGLLAACVTYNVHLFFGLSLPGATFLLWVFLGALLVPHAKVYAVPSWSHETKAAKPLALVATLALFVPIVFAVRLAMADHYFLVEKSAAQQQDTSAALSAMEKTMRYNPYLEIYLTDQVTTAAEATIEAASNPAQPPQATPATGQQWTDEFMAGDAAKKIEMTEALCTRLIELSPWEYDSYLMVTAFYSRLGEAVGGEQGRAYLQKSADIAAKQIKATPDGLALRYTYAMTLSALGDTTAAEEQLRYCVEHDSNFSDAASLLQSLEASSQPAAQPAQ
ncbi:MAG: O-antigen ligase family protein [Actinomycetes bacterium]|jgi:O-antigen ligase|nr:O-antigen ligase family protein [Actinomycetes bacterium]